MAQTGGGLPYISLGAAPLRLCGSRGMHSWMHRPAQRTPGGTVAPGRAAAAPGAAAAQTPLPGTAAPLPPPGTAPPPPSPPCWLTAARTHGPRGEQGPLAGLASTLGPQAQALPSLLARLWCANAARVRALYIDWQALQMAPRALSSAGMHRLEQGRAGPDAPAAGGTAASWPPPSAQSACAAGLARRRGPGRPPPPPPLRQQQQHAECDQQAPLVSQSSCKARSMCTPAMSLAAQPTCLPPVPNGSTLHRQPAVQHCPGPAQAYAAGSHCEGRAQHPMLAGFPAVERLLSLMIHKSVPSAGGASHPHPRAPASFGPGRGG
jgi:hypothetical protein